MLWGKMLNTINDNKLKELLAIGDAAKYLGVSIDTLRRWEKKGKVVPLRSPGGHRYFDKEALDKLFGTKYTREESDKSSVRMKIEETPVSQLLEKNISDQISKPEIQIPIINPIRFINFNSEPPPPPQPVSTDQSQIAEKQSFINKQAQETKVPTEITKPEKEEVNKKLSFQEEQRLDEILFADKKEKSIDRTLLIIFVVIIFAIVDVVLFLLWRKPPTILSPVP